MNVNKIILICVGNIRIFPPALNVYYALQDLGYSVVVVSDGDNNLGNGYIDLKVDYLQQQTLIRKIALYFKVKKRVKEIVEKIYKEGDIIWVIGNDSMKYVDNYLLGKEYILHFLELEENICLSRKLHMFEVDIKKFCGSAKAVVCCEENRAQIMYARWNLKSVPSVIPNKPYVKDDFSKACKVSNSKASEVISKIGDKRLILYQGALTPERRLQEYVKAVDKLGENYIFGVMSQTNSDMSWLEGHNAIHIPYVAAPMHLEVTSNAFIGIVSYVPTGDFFHSLNALYCAPNKIYEYSRFGIPMIGNRIPGLVGTIEKYKAGECVEFNENHIVNAIRKIETGYIEYSRGSENLYNSVDICSLVNDILAYNSGDEDLQ